MLQPSNRDAPRTGESLSQLRVKICSVRLPSTSKLVDICVIMEVDSKYSYRTELIRKKTKTSTTNSNPLLITINESFDVLVTSNSKMKLRVLAPTRLFSTHDIGQIEFRLRTILEQYKSSEQISNTPEQAASSASFQIRLPFDLSDLDDPSAGMMEVVFYGSLLEQKQREHQQQQQQENRNPSNAEQVNIRLSLDWNSISSRRTQLIPP